MILAVDPGTATCGWAVVVPGRGEIVELGSIICPHDPDVDESTDRARRVVDICRTLRPVARRHRITTIAAEAVSLGGPPKARLAMASCLSLPWGALIMFALELGAALLEVRPKLWQQAIQDGAKKIDYDRLYDDVVDYIEAAPWGGPVLAMLMAIVERHRNHAADAGGIGVFTSLRPHLANVIIAASTLHVERKESA